MHKESNFIERVAKVKNTDQNIECINKNKWGREHKVNQNKNKRQNVEIEQAIPFPENIKIFNPKEACIVLDKAKIKF